MITIGFVFIIGVPLVMMLFILVNIFLDMIHIEKYERGEISYEQLMKIWGRDKNGRPLR